MSFLAIDNQFQIRLLVALQLAIMGPATNLWMSQIVVKMVSPTDFVLIGSPVP